MLQHTDWLLGLDVTIPDVSALQLTWVGMTSRWCYYHYHIISCVPWNHWVLWPFITAHPWPRLATSGWSDLDVCFMVSLLMVTAYFRGIGKCFDCLPKDLPSKSISLGGLAVELSTKPLHPTSTGHQLHSCLTLFCKVAVLQSLPFKCLQHHPRRPLFLWWRHACRSWARSCHRLVTAISDEKVSLWPRPTCISQSLAMVIGHELGIERLG